MTCKIIFSTIILSLFFLLFEYNSFAQINCMNIHHNFYCNNNNCNIDYVVKKWIKQCPWDEFFDECVDKTENNIKKIFEKRINNEKNLFCDKYFTNNIKFLIILSTILFITFYIF
jgi:hypothetical protein